MPVIEETSRAGERARGEYVMKLIDNTLEASTFNPEKMRLKLRFEIMEADTGDEDRDELLPGTEHWEWATWSTHPNATLVKWLRGMVGGPVEPGYDTDTLNGKMFRVILGDVPWSFEGQSGVKRTIESIRPYNPKRKHAPVEEVPPIEVEKDRPF